MSKNKEALRFFQAYINEMIAVGGSNLPKSISVSLGAKLGKLLREREEVGIEDNLRKIYRNLNAKVRIIADDQHELDIYLKYSRSFCPIGGKLRPERAKTFQDTICIPYTTSILHTLHPDFKFDVKIIDCILNSNEKTCHLTLKIEEKK